jgi:hypothetical protein
MEIYVPDIYQENIYKINYEMLISRGIKCLIFDLDNTLIMFDSKYMPLHAIGSVIGIFVVCAILDMLRIKFIETPFFCLWDKHYGTIKNKFLKFENKILSKICTSSKSDI